MPFRRGVLVLRCAVKSPTTVTLLEHNLANSMQEGRAFLCTSTKIHTNFRISDQDEVGMTEGLLHAYAQLKTCIGTNSRCAVVMGGRES